MLKIRLRRMGAIRQPHYRIVVADARAPRDGAFIETLGSYNPLTNPATINIDVARYEDWKRKGAQPTDAVVSLVKQYNKAVRLGAQAPTPLTKKAQRAQARAAQAGNTATVDTSTADTAEAAGDAAATQSPGGGDVNITDTPGEITAQDAVARASAVEGESTVAGGEGADGLTAGTGTGPGGQVGENVGNQS